MKPNPVYALAIREVRSLRFHPGVLAFAVFQLFLVYILHRQVYSTSILVSTGGPTVPEAVLQNAVTLSILQGTFGFSLFVGGLLIGYRSIVSEQESGSILLTYSQPIERYELIIGKILGRSAVLLIPLLVVTAIYLPIGFYHVGFAPLEKIILLALATVIYTIICVTIGVSISALCEKSITSAVTAFGFISVELFWKNLAGLLYTTISGEQINRFNPQPSGLLFLLDRLLPTELYHVITNKLIGAPNSSGFAHSAVISAFETETRNVSSNTIVVEQAFQGMSIPFYLSEWFAAVLLVFWFSLFLGTAITIFQKREFI